MFAKVEEVKKELGKLTIRLSWKGSWKNEINCDGVYLFAKYQSNEANAHESIKMRQTSEGIFDFTDKTPEGFTCDNPNLGIYIPDTKLGLFVYPVTPCQDKTHEATITLDCNVEPTQEVQLFILEMVYIPESSHYIGDPENGISQGGTLKNCFYTYPNKGAYLINSEKAILFASEEGCLYSDMDTPNGRQEKTPFTIPNAFPKGYQAMWYMKYSLNTAQYVQFLNCLTREQQKTHMSADISGETIENYYVLTNTNEELKRNSVYCRKTGNDISKPVKVYTYAPMRACNAIAYRDVASFACFAGLRLITELEYEKACRGPLKAVAGEFAWGTTHIGRVFNFIGVDGSGEEIPLAQEANTIANCNFGEGIAPFEKAFKTVPDNPGWMGPVSTGLFERSDVLDGYSKRECTGASYYGVMELSGNIWENLVTVGRPEGRIYDGSHGNGILDENGNHTMPNWPNSDTALGMGVRGGVFVSPSPDYVHMALRVFAAHTKAERGPHCGLRVGF